METAKQNGFWAHTQGWGLNYNPYCKMTECHLWDAFREGWREAQAQSNRRVA